MTNSRYRWVIVAAGGLLGCVAIGGMFSLPVFLQPIARDTGWSVTGVSSAMTIGFLAMACTSMAWGTLSDRVGTLPVVLTGSIVLATSLALASRATSLAAFQLIFGLMVGGSISAIFAPMMATVTGWFDTHRSLAVSLVSAGMGMAPMTMSPLAAWLVSNHDWRTSMQIVAVVVACIMIPVSLLVRRRRRRSGIPPRLDSCIARGDITGKALRSPQFIILLLTSFFCCATIQAVIHTVSYAISCGIPLIAAVTSTAWRFGRPGRPYRVRSARRPALVPNACWCWGCSRRRLARSPTSSCASLPRSTVAAVFGFIYAGTMPLYASLAREFSLRMMGTVIGGTAMAGSLGMARAAGRRSDLRHLCQLRLALYRFLGVWPRRLHDRNDLQAVPAAKAEPSRLRREACSRPRPRFGFERHLSADVAHHGVTY